MSRALPLFAALLLAHSALAADPLAGAWKAHGSLEKWRAFQQLEYDLAWTFGGNAMLDRQLFDLVSRAGRIQSNRYALGGSFADGVWIMPDEKVLGTTPARFYLWTPFYFFAMPFIFADPAVKSTALGVRKVDGVEYEVVKCSFGGERGGDSPEDTYTLYLDRKTARLKLATYTVTFFDGGAKARKGEATENAIVIDEWQDVQGLAVPRKATFFGWKDGALQSPARGTAEFSNVRFGAERPAAGNFLKPAGAVTAAAPAR